MLLTQKLLDLSGIGRNRLHIAWVSSAEAQRFVDLTTAAISSIQEQGPFDAAAFDLQLKAVEATLDTEQIRWLVGKELKLLQRGDVYGRKWEKAKLEAVLDATLEREYQKHLIRQAIIAGHTSVRAISSAIGLPLRRISYLLADMEKTNMVEFKGHEHHVPVFAAL